MPFEKNNKLGFTTKNDTPLDKQPLSIKLKLGDKDRVRSIPDWQDKLRALINVWLNSENV
jgi:hypothetical protein